MTFALIFKEIFYKICIMWLVSNGHKHTIKLLFLFCTYIYIYIYTDIYGKFLRGGSIILCYGQLAPKTHTSLRLIDCGYLKNQWQSNITLCHFVLEG